MRDSVYPGGTVSPEILPEVAIHEIGHVLFRSLDHSPTGLMRAKWDWQDLQNAAIRNLLLTPQQAEMVRSEMTARARLAEAEQRSQGPDKMSLIKPSWKHSLRKTLQAAPFRLGTALKRVISVCAKHGFNCSWLLFTGNRFHNLGSQRLMENQPALPRPLKPRHKL